MNSPTGVSRLSGYSLKSILAVLLCIFSNQPTFAQSVDLVIQGASLSGSSAASGSYVTASGSVYNLGDATASTSNIGYYLSADNVLDDGDNLIGSSNGNGLGAGTSSYRNVTFPIPSATAPGSYYILYKADYLNGVAESNEGNNVSSVSIAVLAPTVDLFIKYASISVDQVAPGGNTYGEAGIYNQGNTTASSSDIGYFLSTNTSFEPHDIYLGFSSGGSVDKMLIPNSFRWATGGIYLPANTPPGTYYILFVADHRNEVAESNETNNTTARQITVQAPSVDLVVQSPYLFGSSGAAGASISTESRIQNLGNSTASSSNIGYYLSANNTFDSNDVFVGSSTGGSLTGSNYTYRYGSITIPPNTAPGSYFILFIADYLNGVTESNETNNVSSASFTVVPPSIDLTLSALTISPPSISAGNPISVDVTVYNQGNTHASSSNLGYYLSANTTLDAADELIDFSNGQAISASNSAYRPTSVTIPAATPPGNYYLIVSADYLNSLSETNENNNKVHAALTVTAPGTTFITPRNGSASFTTCTGKVYDDGGTGNYSHNSTGTITLNPATAGNKIRLTFNSFSLESCCDRLYIYDGTSTSAPLIGAYYTNPGTVYATNSTGALTLRFYTDGSVAYSGFEADIACVTTVPLPDLTILSPTATPSSLAAGTTLSVSANVSNSSTVNASSSNLGYYLSANNTFESSDIYLGGSTAGTITAGNSSSRSASLTIPANTAPGNYFLLYVADPQNALSEDNEANNVASVAITVLEPTIDLLLLSAFTSSNTLAAGNTFTVTSFIANQGSTPASGSYVSYLLSANNTFEPSDISLGNSYGGVLAGGNSSQRSRSLTLPAGLPAGNYYILFVADSVNQVSETNETNNTRSVAITVTSPNYVDLDMTTKSIAKTTLLTGEQVAASGTIVNAGNVTAPRSAVGFYLSTDATLDASDVLLSAALSSGPLAPNATEEVPATLTIPANTAPGNYYVVFWADYNNQIAESEESNGPSVIPVSVAHPAIDLLVDAPVVSPAALLPGAEITATAAVRNQGTTAATTSTMGYYLSANATLDAADELLGFYAGGALAADNASARHTARFNLPAATPAGAYHILFVADHNDDEAETNEANNVQAVAITIAPALANLTFNATTLSASILVTGELLSVADSLQNYGTVAAQTSNVGYYLSENATLDAADVLLGTSAGHQLANRPHSGAYKTATLIIPANTAPGNYYVLFVADPDDLVTESNETDNIASQAITLTAPDVDLIVQNQALSPAVAAAGNAVSVSASISNQGTTPANSSAIAYYLSANPTWEDSDVLLAVSAGNTLAAGSSAYRSATVIIPAETTAGTYYLLFMGDHANQTAETDEANNVASLAITVSAPTAVDLVVQSPSGFPSSVTAGSQVSVSSFIFNQGVAAAASSTVGYYLSANNQYDPADVLLGFSPGAALAAGGSAAKTETFTIPAGTSAGNYYLLFVADHTHSEAESDETNNTKVLAISVSAPVFADFTIQSPAVAQASVLAGSSVAASATLRNLGTTEAASSPVGYYLSADNVLDANDLLLDISAGNSLAAGASAAKSATLTIPGSTPAGSYYVLFAADPDSAVAESSEANNLGSQPLTVLAPVVDLLVQSQALTPASVLPGNTLAVSAEILNQGTIAAATSTVGYYLSDNGTLESGDVLLDFAGGSALAAGGTASKSATLTIPANTPAGDYFVVLVADHGQAETESDETNNSSAVAFTVITPAVDLAIQSPAASVAALIAGHDLSVSASIRNSGTAAAPASPVHYYLSANTTWDGTDVALGNTAGGALAAGASAFKTATIAIPANTATGNYYILYVADEVQAVAESEETNNVSAVALAVTAPNIDLMVQNASVAPASVVSGNTVSVAATIANTGNVAAPASNLGYYLSTNITLESTDVLLGHSTEGALAAGATAARTATVTIPANTAAGNYYVLFAADHTEAVIETNETNNVAYVALRVAAPTGPDLVAGVPSVYTANFVKGIAYQAAVTITNRGTTNSTASSVGFYLSANDTYDDSDTFLAAASGSGLSVNGYSTLTAYLSIPQNITPGAYKLFAVADYLNTVAETNETNNINAYDIAVVAATVDLIVQSTTLGSDNLVAGASATVTANLSNAGNTAAQSSDVAFYLSTNNTFEATDVLLATVVNIGAGGRISASGTASRSASVTIPAATIPGAYYILAVVDRDNAIVETSEINNFNTAAVTVQAPTFDLSIPSLTGNLTTIFPGSSVNVSVTLQNSGNSSAPSSDLSFYVSANATLEATDTRLNSVSGGSFPAGTTATRTVLVPTNDLSAGNYFIIAVADPLHTVAETNENNNTNSFALTVETPVSNLAMRSVTVAKTTLTPGEVTNVTGVISNTGNTNYAGGQISFYLSADTTYGSSDVFLTDLFTMPPAGQTETKTGPISIPANTALGTYYILAMADKINMLSETSEADNISRVAITVEAPVVDLVMLQASVPSVVVAGSRGTFGASITNQGNITAASCFVGVWLSADNSLDITDIFIGGLTNGSALAPGETRDVSTSLTIPDYNMPPGSYQALVKVDYTDAVTESNEANNILRHPITVTLPVVDLTLKSAAVSPVPTTIIAGNTLTASVTIENIGTLQAASSTVGYYLSTNTTFESSDLALSSSAGTSLAGGANASKTAVLTIPAQVAEGNYYLIFVADPESAVTEGDETNNFANTRVYVVRPFIDLEIYSLTVSSTNTNNGIPILLAGYATSASAAIYNRGNTTAPSSEVKFYLSDNNTYESSDQLLSTVTGGNLATQTDVRTANITIPATTTAGSYYVIALIDPDNALSESNEMNNIRSAPITVTSPPTDLALIAVYPSVDRLAAGASMYALVNISITGNTLPPSTDIKVYLSADQTLDPTDVAVDTIDIGGLSGTPERTANIRIPDNTPLGSYHLLVVMDKDNIIRETDETNNMMARPITVIEPGVDFVIQSHTSIPASIPAGNWVNVTAALANIGTSDASYSSFGFYLSTNTTWESTDLHFQNSDWTGFILSAGSFTTNTASLTIPANTPPGNYYVLVVADNTRSEIESDENNNVISVPITITGPISDLLFTPPVTVSPNPVTAGTNISAVANVVNGGTASANVVIDYFLSQDNILDTLGSAADVWLGTYQSATALNGGNAAMSTSKDLTIPAATAGGNYYVIFRLDPAQAVAESNETNNMIALPINVIGVPLADLAIQSPTVTPAVVEAGRTVSLTATLANTGAATATASTLHYYLSADTALDSTDVALESATAAALASDATALKTATLTLPATTLAGSYHLLLVADADSTVMEENEDNNMLAVAISVRAAAPDLTLQNPALSAATVARGAAITATATLANIGTGASRACKVRYYLSANDQLDGTDVDVLLGESDVPALAAGATSPVSTALSIPATTATGDYFMLLVADPASVNAETGGVNNVASVALAVSVANGIEDLQASYVIKVGPNPVPQEVYISAEKLPAGVKAAELTLYDITGSKVVQTRSPLAGRALSTRLHVGHLSQGTYLLHIRVGQQVVIRKIMIAR